MNIWLCYIVNLWVHYSVFGSWHSIVTRIFTSLHYKYYITDFCVNLKIKKFLHTSMQFHSTLHIAIAYLNHFKYFVEDVLVTTL